MFLRGIITYSDCSLSYLVHGLDDGRLFLVISLIFLLDYHAILISGHAQGLSGVSIGDLVFAMIFRWKLNIQLMSGSIFFPFSFEMFVGSWF